MSEKAYCGLCGGIVVDGEPTCQCWEREKVRRVGISGTFKYLKKLVESYNGGRDQLVWDLAVGKLDRWDS